MKEFTNYKYYVNEKKKTVIAVSTYAGKTVKGIAVCAPQDEFDIEKGKKLAAARCNLKVAKKRTDNARKKLNQAEKIQMLASKHENDMAEYFCDAVEEEDIAVDKLHAVLSDLR